MRPHAYNPATNPELSEGVLARRVVAFAIDVIIIALPLIAAAVFYLRIRLITFGLGWVLFWLLSPALVVWALFYYGITLGGPVHAIVYWVTVSVLSPLILVVGFFNRRRSATARYDRRHGGHQQCCAGRGTAGAGCRLWQIRPLTDGRSQAI